MKKWFSNNAKWLIGMAGVLVLMAAVPLTTEAHGRRWSGADPALIVNGQTVNLYVEWETGHACDIRGPVELKVLTPKGADTEFLFESNDAFDCDGDGNADTVITTNTVVKEGRGDNIVVFAKFRGERGTRFDTRVEIHVDNEIEAICQGHVNSKIRCNGPEL